MLKCATVPFKQLRCLCSATALPKAKSKPLPHMPVMPMEVISALNPTKGGTFLDMTFGAGGHSRHLLETCQDIDLYGLDRDPVTNEYGHALSCEFRRFCHLLGRFNDLPSLLNFHGVPPESLDGIMLDLGASSMQFDNADRGFSVSSDGPLDMRMNQESGEPTAADVIRHADEVSLARIFKIYGEEKHAKKIARAVVEARYLFKPLETTGELAALVASILGDDEVRMDKLQRPSHVATKTFQALRIFVNDELNHLSHAMDLAYRYLKVGGRIVVLTFHSLEDRIVKRHLLGIDLDEAVSNTLSQKYHNAAKWHSEKEFGEIMQRKWQPLYKHVLLPTEAEVAKNPRSRSAKLRAAIKVSM